MIILDRKYEYPPVIEALCEIFFVESEWDETVPGRFYDLVKTDFPIKRQIEVQSAEMEFNRGARVTAGVQTRVPRMQFVSKENDRILQIDKDLLVVNQLRPYPRFRDWRPEIGKALSNYRGLTGTRIISHISLRYINRIEIPKIDGKVRYGGLFLCVSNVAKG